MWKKFVKDYLSFTKKDRIAVIVLVTLIFMVVLLPYIWPVKEITRTSKQDIEKIRLQTAQLNKPDAANLPRPEAKQYESKAYNYAPEKNAYTVKGILFYFDPNTIDAAGWQKLGIREKTAATIVKYVSRGGKFRQAEDIGKIYGLRKDEYERLLPYVKIADQPVPRKQYKEEIRTGAASDKPLYLPRKAVTPAIIEINAADSTAFIALPGIGSKLAARIINFRDKLGGFYAVQQVAETYGLPDSTYSKVQRFLQCNSAMVHQLNINTADANTLKQHPYIRWNLANAIVQYRVQHGNFTTVNDLQQIALITPEILQKIKPYLQVQ